MNISNIQQLIERIGGLLRNEVRTSLHEYELLPIQFEVLYYLSICNRYSDTPMAVSEFLGQTKGTVSQTLAVLEKKGFIEKQQDDKDRRVIHMKVTAKGRKLLKAFYPAAGLDRACSTLDKHDLTTVEYALRSLLRSIQKSNGFMSFGQCSDCIYNIKKSNSSFLCGLTKEKLSYKETRLICREFIADENKMSQGNRV